MDKMTEYKHKNPADGRWNSFSFSQQMANIGSEVSRGHKMEEKRQNGPDGKGRDKMSGTHRPDCSQQA